MPKNLRTFLQDAAKFGHRYDIDKEVDPTTQIGALCDESDRPVVFSNVKGYEGWTIASNLANNRNTERLIFANGNRIEREDVIRSIAAAIEKGPTPPKIIKDAPVKEIVWDGDDANLTRLPICRHSELDGARYIGGAIGIVVDPETGFHNTTWPRTMVTDGRESPFMIFSPHVNRIAGKYAKLNKPMPMALVIGAHPAWELAASLSIHHPHCGELDYAANFLGEDADFVKCDSIDVNVPAESEIVVEGEVLPGVVRDEGPFGNYLGTYTTGPISRDGIQKGPIFRVKRITMRKNPIYRHLQSTVWTEHQRLCMMPIEASLFTALSEMGLDIHDIHMPSWGGCSLTLVQMTPRGPGQARDALLKSLMYENTTLNFMSVLAVAVNRDVNIYDARDIMWALTIRANWAENVQVSPGHRSSPLVPAAKPVPGQGYRLNAKTLIDATLLPTKSDDEWWEHTRAWPKGKGQVRLQDFVEDYMPSTAPHERLLSLDQAIGLKPGKPPKH